MVWAFFLGVVFVLGLLAALAVGVYFGWQLHKREIEEEKSGWDVN